MVHPLIRHDQGTLRSAQVRDGVLGQHGNIKGSDQLRYAMVYFRVRMIRTPGEHNTPFSGLL